MSFHLLLSFVCVHICPGLSVYVLGRPGLDNEVGFRRLSLCTWFPFIATTHTFVLSCPLFMSSFFCLAARAYTFALALVFLASPPGGVCV